MAAALASRAGAPARRLARVAAATDRAPPATRTIVRRVPKAPVNERPGPEPYQFFTGFPFPLGPLATRKTCCREVRLPGVQIACPPLHAPRDR